MARRVLVLAALAWLVCLAPLARADFPYAPGGLAPGVAPNEFSETADWKLAATPDGPLANPLTFKVNGQADELCGIRGMSVVDLATVQPAGSCATGTVHTAWQLSTGRPDVTIAVLDSGVEWNDQAAMTDLRDKIRLNQGELPAPRDDLRTPLASGVDCSRLTAAAGGDYARAAAMTSTATAYSTCSTTHAIRVWQRWLLVALRATRCVTARSGS